MINTLYNHYTLCTFYTNMSVVITTTTTHAYKSANYNDGCYPSAADYTQKPYEFTLSNKNLMLCITSDCFTT